MGLFDKIKLKTIEMMADYSNSFKPLLFIADSGFLSGKTHEDIASWLICAYLGSEKHRHAQSRMFGLEGLDKDTKKKCGVLFTPDELRSIAIVYPDEWNAPYFEGTILVRFIMESRLAINSFLQYKYNTKIADFDAEITPDRNAAVILITARFKE